MKAIGDIIGQVFVYENNKTAIKILSKETVKQERGYYVRYRYSKWYVDKFIDYGDYVTDESLEKYYQLITGDFEKIYKQGIGIINGTELMPVMKAVEFNKSKKT